MKRVLLTLLSISCFLTSWAQKDLSGISLDTLVIENDSIPVYHYTSMKRILPNRPIHLIVMNDEGFSLARVQKEYDSLDPNEQWHLVYLVLRDEKISTKLVDQSVNELFYRFFFDRNRVHISILNKIELSEPKHLDPFLENLASLRLDPETYASYTGDQANLFIYQANADRKIYAALRSQNSFEKVTIKEMPSLQIKKNITDSYQNTKGTHSLAITNGYFQVSKGRAVAFDEETLVDLRTFNSLWTLSYDYMISQRLGVGFRLGFTFKKDEESTTINTVQGTSISGSVSGGALFQLGLSTRFLIYSNKRLSLFPEIGFGRLSASIGGGTGGVSITQNGITSSQDQSERQSQNAGYFDIKIGGRYRLGKSFFLSGSINHSQSNFNEDFGSVSGFSGTGLHLGFGLVF